MRLCMYYGSLDSAPQGSRRGQSSISASAPPHAARYPSSRMSLLFLGHCEVVVAESYLTIRLQRAVRLGITVCVLHCLRLASVVSQNLRFDRRQSVLSSSPNRNLVDDSCHPRSLSVATFRATIEPPAEVFCAGYNWSGGRRTCWTCSYGPAPCSG